MADNSRKRFKRSDGEEGTLNPEENQIDWIFSGAQFYNVPAEPGILGPAYYGRPALPTEWTSGTNKLWPVSRARFWCLNPIQQGEEQWERIGAQIKMSRIEINVTCSVTEGVDEIFKDHRTNMGRVVVIYDKGGSLVSGKGVTPEVTDVLSCIGSSGTPRSEPWAGLTPGVAHRYEILWDVKFCPIVKAFEFTDGANPWMRHIYKFDLGGRRTIYNDSFVYNPVDDRAQQIVTGALYIGFFGDAVNTGAIDDGVPPRYRAEGYIRLFWY